MKSIAKGYNHAENFILPSFMLAAAAHRYCGGFSDRGKYRDPACGRSEIPLEKKIACFTRN